MFRFAIAVLITVASSRRGGEIELTREPEECQAVDSTKKYFDGLRDKYQIQECTKRDVCLLMCPAGCLLLHSCSAGQAGVVRFAPAEELGA